MVTTGQMPDRLGRGHIWQISWFGIGVAFPFVLYEPFCAAGTLFSANCRRARMAEEARIPLSSLAGFKVG
jgi:hypothetical protein